MSLYVPSLSYKTVVSDDDACLPITLVYRLQQDALMCEPMMSYVGRGEGGAGWGGKPTICGAHGANGSG